MSLLVDDAYQNRLAAVSRFHNKVDRHVRHDATLLLIDFGCRCSRRQRDRSCAVFSGQQSLAVLPVDRHTFGKRNRIFAGQVLEQHVQSLTGVAGSGVAANSTDGGADAGVERDLGFRFHAADNNLDRFRHTIDGRCYRRRAVTVASNCPVDDTRTIASSAHVYVAA